MVDGALADLDGGPELGGAAHAGTLDPKAPDDAR